MAGVKNSNVDMLHRSPVGSAEYFEVLQVSGIWIEGWLPLAQSMAKELGPFLVEEASLLEEEVIDKSCAAMVGALACPKVITWGAWSQLKRTQAT